MADAIERDPKQVRRGSTTTPPNKRFYAEMPDNEAWDAMTEAEQTRPSRRARRRARGLDQGRGADARSARPGACLNAASAKLVRGSWPPIPLPADSSPFASPGLGDRVRHRTTRSVVRHSRESLTQSHGDQFFDQPGR